MQTVLVVDDEKVIRLFLKQSLSERGLNVSTAETGERALKIYKEEFPDLVFLDLKLPKMDGLETLNKIKEIDSDAMVVIITSDGQISTVVKAMKAGAYDFIEKPFETGQVTHILEKALETNKLKREVQHLRDEQKRLYGFEHVMGKSKAMQSLFKIIDKIVKSDSGVILLHGESGTGKSLIAKVVHYHSARADKPFVKVNCTSLPETLIESELFGHEKSAFTDAKAMKRGLFEIADEGTIFLDEIGDMCLSAQAKLLTVLEDRTFKRVGGIKDIEVDVRILTATNKNLASMVKEGSFREDLYYRLMVIPIHIPPLRDRREDILPLVKFFISEFSRDLKGRIKYISPEAEDIFLQYNWPGNVRELRNIIERIIILETGDTLLPEHLPEKIRNGEAAYNKEKSSFLLPISGICIESVEKDLIKQALSLSMGNQTHAAKLLSLSRDAFRYRMKKYETM